MLIWMKNVPTTKLKTKPMMIAVSQLRGLISAINFPVILDSLSQLMFLKGLWRHIFSKMHFTCSFIIVMSYVYFFYIHIVTMHAISISSIFTLSIHFSVMCIYIVIRQIISLFCIVLHFQGFYSLCSYIFYIYSAREHCGLALHKLIHYFFYLYMCVYVWLNKGTWYWTKHK